MLVRVQAMVPPGFSGEAGILRALFRVRRDDNGPGKGIVLAAVGTAEDRPALLEGEAPLAPGSYTVEPFRGPARKARILVRGTDMPVRVFCRHRSADPSFVEFTPSLSPRRRLLGGVFRMRRMPCCRREVLRQIARAENNFDLVLVEPLRLPVHVRVDGETRIVRKGEYLVVNPASQSPFDPATPFPLEMRAVHISQPLLRQARDSLGLGKELGPFGFDPRPRPMTRELKFAIDACVEAANRQETLGGDWDMVLMIQHLLLHLLREHPNRLNAHWSERVLGAPRDPRLARAIAYLRDHLADPFSAGAVARAASLSPPHLRHLFQKHLGTSPIHYLQALRVETAKGLLRDHYMKVEAVARAVGYSDMASFRRLFRRHFKRPPNAFLVR